MRRLLAILILLAVIPPAAPLAAGPVTVTATGIPGTTLRLYDRVVEPDLDRLFEILDEQAPGLPALDDPQRGAFEGVVAESIGSTVVAASGVASWTIPATHIPRDGTLDLYVVGDLDNGRSRVLDAYGGRWVDRRWEDATPGQVFRTISPARADAQPVNAAIDLGDAMILDAARMDGGEQWEYVCQEGDRIQLDGSSDNLGSACRWRTGDVRSAVGWFPSGDVGTAIVFERRLTSTSSQLATLVGATPPKADIRWPLDPHPWIAAYWDGSAIWMSRSGGEGTLLHEFGHQVHDLMLGGIPGGGGQHGSCQVWPDHGMVFGEGFADWFSEMALSGFAFTTERPGSCGLGPGDEGTTLALLGDLSDPAGDDPVAGSFRLVWDVMRHGDHSDGLVDFLGDWQEYYDCRDATLANAILDVAALNSVPHNLVAHGCDDPPPGGGGSSGGEIGLA